MRAILSVTTGGLKLARKIQESLGGDLYTLAKYCQDDHAQEIKGSLKSFMEQIFENYREIVMVMSCGIAVRSIAPYLKSKVTDPAVVVLDEKGNFVISLLSGHLGGANELAQSIALITKGQAVITTASDNLGLESVDMIAKRYQLHMDDLEQVKKVTALLVNGKKVVLVNDSFLDIQVASLNRVKFSEVKEENPDGIIYIGNKDDLNLSCLSIPVAKLCPRSLVLGIGCKKNTAEEKIYAAVEAFFRQHNILLTALKGIATVDLKKDEPGIIALAEKLSLPLDIVERSRIAPIENRFPCSDFVKRTIGVGCVSEPVAYLVSKEGRLVAPKTAYDGITLSLYE